MKIVFVFLISTIFLFYGCEESNPVTPNVSVNNDFIIKYGQSVYIPEENIFITFEDVVEDSRCPQGADCISEGTAKIKLLIRQGIDLLFDTVQTYLPQSIIRIGEINNSYLFHVKNASPYPKLNEKIIKQDYILTLNVSHFTYGFPEQQILLGTGIFGQAYLNESGPGPVRIGFIYERPFSTSFRIINSSVDTTAIQTDPTGKFIVYLQPGKYQIVFSKGYPYLTSPNIFTVTAGKMTFLNIYFDNGIRVAANNVIIK